MKKLFVLISLLFIIGCNGTEPEAVDRKPVDKNDNLSKPVNGQVTLKSEVLTIGTVAAPQSNTYQAAFDLTTKVVTKDYFFATGDSVKTFVINNLSFDRSYCRSEQLPRYFLIADSVFTELLSGEQFQLKANVNYRLQLYMDNLNCTGLKGSFAFKQL